MIVAARTGHRHGLKSPGKRVDLAVDHRHLLAFHIHGGLKELHKPPKTGGDQGLVFALVPARGEQVARNVLAEKAIDGNVLVERAHQVVAVPPRERQEGVALQSVRLAVVHDIHPAAGPPLTEVNRAEGPIHQPFKRVRSHVGEELAHVLGRRRKTEQRKPQPPDQDPAVRFAGRDQRVGFEFREDEAIKVGLRPDFVLGGGRGHALQRLESPLLGACLEVDSPLLPDRQGTTGIKRPVAHPFFQHADFILGQAPLGRHLEIRIIITDRLNQQTLVGLAHLDGRSGVSTQLPTGP